MRKIFRFATTAAALGALAWWVRARLLPQPELTHEPPSAFRSGAGPAVTRPTPPVEAPQPEAAEEAAAAEAPPADVPADDLQRVKGIGPVYAGKLQEIGIVSFQGLANADAAAIADGLDVAESQVADWIGQASSFAD